MADSRDNIAINSSELITRRRANREAGESHSIWATLKTGQQLYTPQSPWLLYRPSYSLNRELGLWQSSIALRTDLSSKPPLRQKRLSRALTHGQELPLLYLQVWRITQARCFVGTRVPVSPSTNTRDWWRVATTASSPASPYIPIIRHLLALVAYKFSRSHLVHRLRT